MNSDRARLNRNRSASLEEVEEMNWAYWLSKTPHDRSLAVEKLRRLKYGKATRVTMERVIEITTWELRRESLE